MLEFEVNLRSKYVQDERLFPVDIWTEACVESLRLRRETIN